MNEKIVMRVFWFQRGLDAFMEEVNGYLGRGWKVNVLDVTNGLLRRVAYAALDRDEDEPEGVDLMGDHLP